MASWSDESVLQRPPRQKIVDAIQRGMPKAPRRLAPSGSGSRPSSVTPPKPKGENLWSRVIRHPANDLRMDDCELVYLPAYSAPDFNPIEEAFSKIKGIWCAKQEPAPRMLW
jgi:hypothetical protein